MAVQLNDLIVELQSPASNITLQLADEGVSGTYFVIENGVPIAVFKDASQDQLCPDNPRLQPKLMRLSVCLARPWGFFTACENSVKGQSYASDELSYILARQIGFEHAVVPDAIIAENVVMNGHVKKGILLEWVPDATSLECHANIFGKLEKIPEKIPFSAFEEMAMFDYLTGNMDRKAGNVLLSKRDNKLYLIDNSWAFSPLQGDAFSFKQYIWGTFPALANKTFSEKIKSKINDTYKKRYSFARLAFETYCANKPPAETVELSYQRALCFLHRIEMIHHLVCQKNATFLQLSQIRFEDSFLQLHKAVKTPLLSSHFIDVKMEYLTQDGIRQKNNDPQQNNYLTPSENRSIKLYGPLSDSSSKLCRALHVEMIRLNEKQAHRNWDGLWRNRYKLKAYAVNSAIDQMMLSLENGRIEECVEKLIKNKDSDLYRAFNKHTSFFFKFTLRALSTDTQAILNLKSAL